MSSFQNSEEKLQDGGINTNKFQEELRRTSLNMSLLLPSQKKK